MTLFDVLRYPISVPPAVEQLEALPKDLFIRWVNHPDNSWNYLDSRFERAHISRWMNHYYYNNEKDLQEITGDLELLRRLIGSYDNL